MINTIACLQCCVLLYTSPVLCTLVCLLLYYIPTVHIDISALNTFDNFNSAMANRRRLKRTNDQPLEMDNSDGVDVPGSVSAFVAGIRKRMKKVSAAAMDSAISTVAQSQSADAAADDVVAGPSGSGGGDGGDVQERSAVDVATLQQGYDRQLKDLRDMVRKQQTQIDFLLSLLGITCIPDLHSAPEGEGPPAPSSSSSPDAAAGGPAAVAADQTGSTNAGRAKANIKPLPLAAEFKQAVVSAVYQDFDNRDRRACNIVVSGLPLGEMDDKQVVSQLVSDEFLVRPEIVRCRRLGQPRDGRVQPLLVTFKQKQHAELLVQNAKRLRRSNNEFVRRSVYVNADVTRAEAHAAYVARCERRQRMTNIRSRDPQQQSETVTLSATAAPFTPSSGSTNNNNNTPVSDIVVPLPGAASVQLTATADVMNSDNSSSQ